MELIDVHAHLTDEIYQNLDEVVLRAKENDVNKIVCSSYNLSSAKLAVKIAKTYRNIFATVGIHPENIEDMESIDAIDCIEKLAKSKKVVAIGEIGLDYHFRTDNKDKQKEIFAQQIQLANALSLPIVVHSRDAIGDTIDILKANKVKKESLLHCYSGSMESANILMKLGFSFSFGGVVTFNNAKNVVEVVRNLPLNRILLETDCPYMTPVPYRGKRNEPSFLKYVAQKIAEIKEISVEELAKITSENAKRLFGI